MPTRQGTNQSSSQVICKTKTMSWMRLKESVEQAHSHSQHVKYSSLVREWEHVGSIKPQQNLVINFCVSLVIPYTCLTNILKQFKLKLKQLCVIFLVCQHLRFSTDWRGLTLAIKDKPQWKQAGKCLIVNQQCEPAQNGRWWTDWMNICTLFNRIQKEAFNEGGKMTEEESPGDHQSN